MIPKKPITTIDIMSNWQQESNWVECLKAAQYFTLIESSFFFALGVNGKNELTMYATAGSNAVQVADLMERITNVIQQWDAEIIEHQKREING